MCKTLWYTLFGSRDRGAVDIGDKINKTVEAETEVKQYVDWGGFDKFLFAIGRLLRPLFSAIARNEEQVAIRELRRVEFIHDYIGNELAKVRIMINRRGWDTTKEEEEEND